MTTITATLESAKATILASNPKLTTKDMKITYIKNGGTVVYPTIDAEGQLHLGTISFRHKSVIDARTEKATARAQAKVERDAMKAEAKAKAKAEREAKKAEAKTKVEA